MNTTDLLKLQDEAHMAYDIVSRENKAGVVQAIAQIEIALQLQGINDKLGELFGIGENDLVRRIAIAIEALNPGR